MISSVYESGGTPIRNNASKWIVEGIEELQQRFRFAMVIFDSDCGGEFINHDVAGWLQARDRACHSICVSPGWSIIGPP